MFNIRLPVIDEVYMWMSINSYERNQRNGNGQDILSERYGFIGLTKEDM